MIPQRLQVKGIKFVLLERGGKKPIQKEWQNKIIEFDNPELLEHIQNGGNYGVMGGGEKCLIIIDFDNEKIQDEIVPKLPATFTVKTGTGKLHKYFFSDKCESFKIFDADMNTLADIQGEKKQVVCANSTHPNGNKYELVEDKEIAFINYSELQALIMPYDKKPKKEEKKYERTNFDAHNDFIEKVKSYLNMETVLNSFGVNTNKNPCACPFHSSKGGKCLGFNRDTAHCFNCDNSWNIFSFVKDMKKCDFKEALEYLSNLAGLQDELQISRRKYFEDLKASRRTEQENIKSEYLDLIKDKKWGEASELLVDYVAKNNYIYTTKDDIKTEVWVYKDGIYIPQGKSEVKEILRDLLGKWYNSFIFNNVIAKLEPDTFISANEFFKQNYIDELPVQNGILNLNTRELKPFTPEKIFFNKLPVEYNSLALCPMIEKFLNDVLTKEDDKMVFYEIGGFSLLKDYLFEKAFMFIGNGRNGKDKSLELIKRLIGVENCCSVPLSLLSAKDFIIAEFFGKMVNMAGDIDNRELEETATFKALTGRSLITAKRKFLQPITFVNYTKFIFACNNLPKVQDNAKGFWDRWVLLEFPYTFLPKEEINKATNKTNLKLRDERIIDKITIPEEMSGLLNKFLDGLDRLKEFKTFSSTKGSEEIKTFWIRNSNSFVGFCMDFIEPEYDNYITKKEVRQKYSQFCKKHKLTPKSDFAIKKTLADDYGVIDSRKHNSIGEDEWVWEGIKWKKGVFENF